MLQYYVHGIPRIAVQGGINVYEIVIAKSKVIFQKTVPSWIYLNETRVIEIQSLPCTIKDLERRYQRMSQTDNIVDIKSEIEDDYSDDSLFNISSWGADLSFRELVSM